MPDSPVVQEIRDRITKQGRLTFAEFQQACLYSPQGGFYSSRANTINTHFGTSPTSHPVFGALIARQLEQMWRLLGEPARFDVIEVGSGDGALARSITEACVSMDSGLASGLRYVASDYEPWWPATDAGPSGFIAGKQRIQRVKGEGLQPFQGVAGRILCNELIDNFPVHRFEIRDGQVKEVFVASEGDAFVEVLDHPSTSRIEERLAGLGLSLPNGFRGEVNLAIEDWLTQVAETLERGFVLSIDYGELAPDLYSIERAEGTIICFSRHVARSDPYQDAGQQDITAQVDFTSLMRLGEERGLTTVGYSRQRDFLENLGFAAHLEDLARQGLSEAMMELRRMAMMELVEPDAMGNFKVLAQAKGLGPGIKLEGFRD
jgi:SAM-dependent MidA family methyltransferase